MEAILSKNELQLRPRTKLDVLRSNLDTQVIAKDNLDNYEFNFWAFGFSLLATLFILTLPMFADEASYDIMGVINSNILRGNNQIVSKYSGVLSIGAQFIITACGFFIIALKTCTIAFTLLYLTHPRFWNKVSDIKKESQERAKGGGDWLATIVSWLTPDVKSLSEYGQVDGNEEAMYDIGGIQTIGTYVRKNAVQFIVLITLASILWSGKLLQLVGLMSKGCEAVVDFALNIDYGGKVTSVLEADRDFQFLYDVNQVNEQNKQKFAKALYSKVKMAVPDNNTSEFYNDIGTNIKEYISNMSADLASSSAPYVKWDNPTLTFSITWNTAMPTSEEEEQVDNTETKSPTNGIWVIPASELITDGLSNITTTQQKVRATGVFYVSFSASQVYENNVKEEKEEDEGDDEGNGNGESSAGQGKNK